MCTCLCINTNNNVPHYNHHRRHHHHTFPKILLSTFNFWLITEVFDFPLIHFCFTPTKLKTITQPCRYKVVSNQTTIEMESPFVQLLTFPLVVVISQKTICFLHRMWGYVIIYCKYFPDLLQTICFVSLHPLPNPTFSLTVTASISTLIS